MIKTKDKYYKKSFKSWSTVGGLTMKSNLNAIIKAVNLVKHNKLSVSKVSEGIHEGGKRLSDILFDLENSG